MAGTTDSRGGISFDEVAVIFSEEEWEMLSDQQRNLYMEVMRENYEHFIYLGLKVPIILSWLQSNNNETEAGNASLEPQNHKDPAANHVRGKRTREDQAAAYSHPGNGAIKRSSKRVRLSKDERDVSSSSQSSPAPHGRNLRERKRCYCPHCDKCFNYSSALDAHLRVHSGDKPHKCADCNQSFSYKSELIVHRRKHSKSAKKASNGVQNEPPAKAVPQQSLPPPNSSINGASQGSSPSVDPARSPDTQTAPSPDTQTAPSTQASTSSGAPADATLPQTESEKPLKCNYCEKRFNDRSILEAHHRIHTGKLAYPCSLCDMSFSKPSLLAAHNNTHKEGKPFQCDQCDKNFNDESLLVAHKRTHTGEKPHKCSHCNKWFPNRSSLVEHEECHLRPKPYKCRHCEKSFNDKSLLITHEGVHTDTKPFKCNQCSESFFLKTQLMAHQANHAPNKPFPCNQCERSFNKKETLLAHIRVHNMQSVQAQKKQKP